MEIKMKSVLEEVSQIMHKVFNLKDLNVTRESSAENIRGWDSLNHVSLIIAIEAFYKIKFKASEIAQLKNVGELVDLVESRVAQV